MMIYSFHVDDVFCINHNVKILSPITDWQEANTTIMIRRGVLLGEKIEGWRVGIVRLNFEVMWKQVIYAVVLQ